MKSASTWVASFFVLVASAPAWGQAVALPVRIPVDHPVLASIPIRTPAAWRKGVEQFGESFASESLRRQGFKLENVKLPGNRGIDLLATRRNSAGRLLNLRFVEVKAHYGSGLPRLGQTKVGTQMSRRWLADRLRELHSRGGEGRKLALEIARFRRARGIPLARLGEVYDINLGLGKFTVRNPITMAEKAGPISIQRLLDQMASGSRRPAFRSWAQRQCSQLAQLQTARMETWLNGSPSSRALAWIGLSKALPAGGQTMRAGQSGIIRVAGPFAIAAAVAWDAKAMYDDIRDYRLGKISRRELTIAMARKGGGLAGFWAGAEIGAWVGSFGGPLAWLTMPAGALIGGTVGYWVGSSAGEGAAHLWYDSLDAGTREQVARWLRGVRNPLNN